MGKTNSKIQLNDVINCAINGFIFGLLASIISFVVFMSILNISSEYFLQIFFANLFLWEAISFLHIRKLYALSFLGVGILCALFYVFLVEKEPLINYVGEISAFILNSSPSEAVFTHEKYGDAIKWGGYLALCVPLLALYYLSAFPIAVGIFGVLATAAFVVLSQVATWNDYTVLFLSFLFVVALLFNLSLYKKGLRKNTVTQSYHRFQIKRVVAISTAFAIMITAIQFVPRDYYSREFINEVNGVVDDVFDSFDYLEDMYTQVFVNEDESILLGGDLRQNDEVYFTVSTWNDLKLKTNVYDYYTGDGFEKTKLLTEDENLPFHTELDFMRMGNIGATYYEIVFEEYNSQYFPQEKNIIQLTKIVNNTYAQAPEFKTNEYSEIFSEGNFEQGDRYDVMIAEYSDEYYDFIMAGMLNEDMLEVDDMYLQLPDTVTQRTHDLAEQIKLYALGEVEYPEHYTYDEEVMRVSDTIKLATMVTGYLLQEYEYSTTPGNILTDDFVDSFLFEQKEGYCTSFATSLLVLLRSMGIPCRYVSGYVVNNDDWEYLENLEITGENKHAWVEVFLPGVGFVDFDPTPATSSENISEQQYLGLAAFLNGEDDAQDSAEEDVDSSVDTGETEAPQVPDMPEMEQEVLPQNPLEVVQEAQSSGESVFVAVLKFLQESMDIWLPPLMIYFVAVALSLSAIFYIDAKKRKIKVMMASNDFEIVYNSLTNLLAMVRLKQGETETSRQFFYRVYKYYHPFGVEELSSFHVGSKAGYSDFSPRMSTELERIVTMLEECKYKTGGYNGDVSVITTFRNSIDLHIRKCIPEIFYLIRIKIIKKNKNDASEKMRTNVVAEQ